MALFALMAVSVAACGPTPPSAYQHQRDKFLAAVPAAMFDDDYYPCFRTINGAPGRLSDEECYRFNGPARMRGVWVNGFEAGRFYPGVSFEPASDARTDYWLEMKRSAVSPQHERQVRLKKGETRYIYLDFIGRRTAVEGGYGHMGMAKHLIIVDRLLVAKPLN